MHSLKQSITDHLKCELIKLLPDILKFLYLPPRYYYFFNVHYSYLKMSFSVTATIIAHI